MERLFKGFMTGRGQLVFSMQNGISFPVWLILLATLWLGGCQSSPPAASEVNEPPPVYTLGPGDRIRVTVYQREDLSGDFEIDSSGRVSLPFVRGVQVTGLTVPGVEEAIIERLKREQFISPKVSVDLTKSRSVCVLGEVNKPGCFDYVYGMRATTVIAMAGGYTYRAEQDNLEIMRAIGKKVTGTHHILVYPGDVIEVSERLF